MLMKDGSKRKRVATNEKIYSNKCDSFYRIEVASNELLNVQVRVIGDTYKKNSRIKKAPEQANVLCQILSHFKRKIT